MRSPFSPRSAKRGGLELFYIQAAVFFFDRNRSVQTDLLTGEQSLDSCFEGGELRGVQAVRSLNDGSCGLLGVAQRFQIHLQACDL